jgi:hypothetical protein
VINEATRRKKPISQLSDALEKQCLSYALTAAASGVAVLALAEPSRAEVVYTPANQSIWANGGVLDLNNDGIVDFQFGYLRTSDHTSCARAVFTDLYIASAVRGNAIRGPSSALPSSILVGQNAKKFTQKAFMAGWGHVGYNCSSQTHRKSHFSTFGPFADTTDRYLGLQFSVNGETYYGWARFNVTVDPGRQISAILTGYAYETTPGAPIFTGNEFGNELREIPKPRPPARPATLGRLAQGAQGLATWRINMVKKPQ